MKTLLKLLLLLTLTFISHPTFAAQKITIESLDVNYQAADKVVVEVHLSNAKFDLTKLQAAFPLDRQMRLSKTDFASLNSLGATVSSRDGKWLVLEFPQVPVGAEEVALKYGGSPIVAAVLMSNEVSSSPDVAANATTKAYCRPQCTDYVHSRTNINFTRCWGKLYGSAGEWYTKAKQCGFETSSSKPADRSILELPSPAHVIYIEDSKKLGGNKYRLTYSDRNWDNHCGLRKGTASYDRDKRQISFGGKWYRINGFITRW